MAVVPSPTLTQGARLVVNDVNCQAVCNPDGTQISGGGGGSQNVAFTPITQHASIVVPASTTQSIPIGAREWTITILTGTATFNGAAGLPAGFSDSGEAALVAAISITTDATSTAYVRWGT